MRNAGGRASRRRSHQPKAVVEASKRFARGATYTGSGALPLDERPRNRRSKASIRTRTTRSKANPRCPRPAPNHRPYLQQLCSYGLLVGRHACSFGRRGETRAVSI